MRHFPRTPVRAAQAFTLALLLSPVAARAQSITYLDLTPSDFQEAAIYAGMSTQQGGSGLGGGAAIWSGTVASYVSLSPITSTASQVSAVSGTQQAGYATLSGIQDAALWSGTMRSFVNLNPITSSASAANALTATQQGGYATISGVQKAGIWSGTATSFVSLNPTGSTASAVNAMAGNQQGGYATLGGIQDAALWSGTPGSFVNLSPTSFSPSASQVLAMSGPQQVGFVTYSGVIQAMAWSGTAASAHLLPLPDFGAAMDFSEALATDGTNQAGFSAASITGPAIATLWTSNGAIDLGSFFSTASEATAIWDTGTDTFVGGWTQTANGPEAIIWDVPDSLLPETPEPSSTLLLLSASLLPLFQRPRRK